MVHGLNQIMEMNQNAEDHERAVKLGICEPGPWRPLTVVERSRLNERLEENREVSFDPGFLENECANKKEGD